MAGSAPNNRFSFYDNTGNSKDDTSIEMAPLTQQSPDIVLKKPQRT
jgi:hypothetical protein